MFTLTPPEDSELDQAISHVYSNMAFDNPGSEEYGTMVEQLSKLYALKQTKSPMAVSPDTLATIFAHLAGILIIVRHEQMHVITTKALTFLTKLR